MSAERAVDAESTIDDERVVTEILACIESDKFCAGIFLVDDVVTEAAPIVRYMQEQRWSRDRVREYCKERSWKIAIVWEIKRRKPD